MGEITLVGTLTRVNDGQATLSIQSEKNIAAGETELWFGELVTQTAAKALKATGHSLFAANEGTNDAIARWDKTAGQMEIGLKYRTDALQACDEGMQFKRLVKGVAERHGMIASFMAKPYSAWTGCGQHLHVSLADEKGKNVFATSDDPTQNVLLRQAIGGMKATMADGMAIFAPNAN